MRVRIRLRLTMFMTILGLTLLVPSPQSAEAGVIDRIKDIYNTPERIAELQQQYMDAQAQLKQQQEQLQESLRQAEEFAAKQEELQRQNEQLLAQNASLSAELERAQQDKRLFTRKLILSAIIVLAFLCAYLLSIRIWRYVVWRRQRAGQGGDSRS
ncbi:hypothetical protein ACFO9Q_05435 [Paenibacillus sp. GCM10023252]|uniref:hypothetical protein n=1 Tax=Paenibacillus sp. GCM10023252 TaxID=3252649 RepID=UPI00360F91C6